MVHILSLHTNNSPWRRLMGGGLVRVTHVSVFFLDLLAAVEDDIEVRGGFGGDEVFGEEADLVGREGGGGDERGEKVGESVRYKLSVLVPTFARTYHDWQFLLRPRLVHRPQQVLVSGRDWRRARRQPRKIRHENVLAKRGIAIR